MRAIALIAILFAAKLEQSLGLGGLIVFSAVFLAVWIKIMWVLL